MRVEGAEPERIDVDPFEVRHGRDDGEPLLARGTFHSREDRLEPGALVRELRMEKNLRARVVNLRSEREPLQIGFELEPDRGVSEVILLVLGPIAAPQREPLAEQLRYISEVVKNYIE
jgi:hypothetical protein